MILTPDSEKGWQTSITEGNQITADPEGGSQTVHVNVHVPDNNAVDTDGFVTVQIPVDTRIREG